MAQMDADKKEGRGMLVASPGTRASRPVSS